MPAYDNTNSGVLFRNDKKQGDKQPDYRGNGEFDGVQFQVAGWLKESKKRPGTKFLSLKFSAPYKAPESLKKGSDWDSKPHAAPPVDDSGDGEEVPF